MRRVLFVHSSSELYGSDRSLLNILKNINKQKYKIYVILPCEGPLVEEIKKISDVEITIYDIAVLRRKNLSMNGMISYLRDCRKSIRFIQNYIRENNIEIVDTNTAVVFPGAIAAKRNGIKSVWHIREIINNKTENIVISIMMSYYADVIIANSKATGVALKVKQSKIRVVYNAIPENNSLCVRDNNTLTVGMAGRINRWKGQRLFVDAAQKTHERLPDVKFVIAGEAFQGEESIREELENYIKEKKLENTVILLGQVNDMNRFYNNIDIFVLPSIQPEPFGLVVIEAMEHGIPVIATNHGGPTEIIDDGENGYLVDYKTCDEMANRIIELATNEKDRKELGEKGKRKKREQFSVTKMVNDIETIFNDVLRL